MKSSTYFLSLFFIAVLLSYSLADDSSSSFKNILGETGEKIGKSAGEAYSKAKSSAKDAAASAKEAYNKGMEKLNENIKPKDTIGKLKKLIPGLS